VKEALALARKEAVKKLAAAGIEDKIVVKLHALTVGPEAVGQYRGMSQFHSGAPIFWISNNVGLWDRVEPVDLVRGMTITILHEYGHVIWEYLRVRSSTDRGAKKLWDDLRALSTSSASEDEEEFAETLAQSLYWGHQSWATKLAKRYGALLRSSRG
jgi:hypothetical protein